jgi:hypothetical protein
MDEVVKEFGREIQRFPQDPDQFSTAAGLDPQFQKVIQKIREQAQAIGQVEIQSCRGETVCVTVIRNGVPIQECRCYPSSK